MAPLLFAILFILPVINARIEVKVVADADDKHRDIQLSGSSVEVITGKERNSFQLDDSTLKNAVRAYFGKRPDDAYMASPTPWGDLFTSYNWPQVSRILKPQRATIISNKSEPTIVLTQIFKNNSTKPAQFKADISQKVQNTVSSTWSKEGDLTVAQDIEYGFDIKVLAVSGKTKFSYTAKWGESTEKSQTVTVGSQTGVTISLRPDENVVAELHATRGVMKIKVEYEASLSGVAAVNYNDGYKGHYFWSLDINQVLQSGGLKQTLQSSEVIELGYYTDSKVVIRDLRSNDVLYSIPMDLY